MKAEEVVKMLTPEFMKEFMKVREPVKRVEDLPKDDPTGARRFVEEKARTFVKAGSSWLGLTTELESALSHFPQLD